LIRVVFLIAPFKRHMIEKMAAGFSSRIEYEIVTPRYPLAQAKWSRMSFSEKLDEKMLGGASIRDIVQRFRADVVYSDSPLYASQFALMSLRSLKNAPLILHLRGDIWREYWAAFASAPIRRRILSTQQYSYNWAAVVLAAKVTPICRWLQAVVRHYVPRKRSEVVYQGVDPEEFRPEEGFDTRHPSVAIVQNHSILPKVEGLLNFKLVVERVPNVHFYIAEGEAWSQQFLGLVKAHYSNIANVHFVKDITTPKAVSRMLTACDCYVLASGLDCCPTTVLEASLLEKPVLASRIGGIPEIVAEGYTGWSIDNANIDDWVQKIEMLLNDPKLSRRLGGQGRKWVSDRFGWDAIAPKVERLIMREAERKR
jgi:glycosyltransferase involved in cell wall biosynthesis